MQAVLFNPDTSNKVDKLWCIVTDLSCTKQRNKSVYVPFSKDVASGSGLGTCQATEVLLQCIMCPLNNTCKAHTLLLLSVIYQWNVEAGETGSCSNVRTPSPIRSTVWLRQFLRYDVIAWRRVGSRLLVKVAGQGHYNTWPKNYRLLHIGPETKMWVWWTSQRYLICAGEMSNALKILEGNSEWNELFE